MRLLLTTVLSLVSSASAFVPAATFGLSPTSSTSLSLHTGTCKWFDTEKGFGFIVPDDGSRDVFVHQTAIQKEGFRSLADGEPVQFEVEVDERTGKTKAVSVTGPGGADVKGAPFPDTRGGTGGDGYDDGDDWY